MRYWFPIALTAVIHCLCSPAAQAQATRPLTIQMDSVRFNVCDDIKTFLIPVRIGDIPVGDSLVGLEMYLGWDKTTIEIEDQAILSSETLGQQFADRNVVRDRDNGTMLVQLGNTTLKPVAGTGKPLFFLKGKVIAPDTVGGNFGWIQVFSATFESKTKFDPIDMSKPGMVSVTRDTTPAFTGAMSVDAASLDTAHADTVTLTIGNLRNRRVRRIDFSLRVDPSYVGFLDTIQTGTIADQGIWASKEVNITSEVVSGTLVAQSDLKTDGALLRLVLQRRTDSAFQSTIDVLNFNVNGSSCLGKLLVQGAAVDAKAVKKEDTSASVVEDRAGERGEAIRVECDQSTGVITIHSGGEEIAEVEIFDVNGERLLRQPVERDGASTLRVRLTTVPPSGSYFVGLLGRNEIVYKRFTIKK